MRDYTKIKGGGNPNYKTGLATVGSRGSLYNSWQCMKQRCCNPNNPKYSRYGGRGIKVCEEWMTIQGFIKWAYENGWKQGLSIDRIDNNGNYCPENCRWVTINENSRKKKTTKIDLITAQEIRSRINENWNDLAKEYNCTHGNIWFIMHNFTHVPDGEHTKRKEEVKEKRRLQ